MTPYAPTADAVRLNWTADQIGQIRRDLSTPRRLLRWWLVKFWLYERVASATWLPYVVVNYCRKALGGPSAVGRMFAEGRRNQIKRILSR